MAVVEFTPLQVCIAWHTGGRLFSHVHARHLRGGNVARYLAAYQSNVTGVGGPIQ
jgi:hypothetical protein